MYKNTVLKARQSPQPRANYALTKVKDRYCRHGGMKYNISDVGDE